MNNYKIAFIHGNNFEEKGLVDGSIELYGEMNQESLHVTNLLEYAKNNFPEFPIFEKLTIRHQPEVVAYFMTKLGMIVFFNMTKYDINNLQRHGKIGMFMLPNELTEKQEIALKKFGETIPDFNISINYDILMDMGILDSKTIQGCNHERPKELIELYLERMNKKGQDNNILL